MFSLFRLPRPDRTELREVVDELPLAVRIAMLTGVRRERIIAGGYADGRGGVCPMLAAHRHGARFAHPDFARTWDEFAEAPIEGHRDVRAEHVGALADVLRASIEAELRTADHPVPAPPNDATEPAPAGPAEPPADDASVVRGARRVLR